MISCPACGFDESRLAKSLRLGCSTCYTTFAPHIATFLPRLHRGVIHTGKKPPALTVAELERRIDRLVAKVQELAPGSPEATGLCQLQSSCHAAFDQIRRHNNPS
jgi:protein-arginine kinase activator protein McsA